MRNPAILLSAVVLLLVPGLACSDGSAPATPTVPAPSPTATTVEPAPSPTGTPVEATSTPAVEPTSPATPQATATGVPQASAIVVQQGPAGRRAVTLTFDAGADAGFTVQILEVLAGAGVKAAFGLTGKWAEQNPELVASIAAAGHDLINHSYDHSSFTGLSTSAPPLSQAARFEQLDRTEGIVLGLTGRSTRPLFRPPYGDYDESVNRDLALRGYLYNVMWTVDSRGWQGIAAEEIVQRCLSLAVPGAIYVFHVGSASQDAAALPAVIEGLRAAGYEMVPLSQILP